MYTGFFSPLRSPFSLSDSLQRKPKRSLNLLTTLHRRRSIETARRNASVPVHDESIARVTTRTSPSTSECKMQSSTDRTKLKRESRDNWIALQSRVKPRTEHAGRCLAQCSNLTDHLIISSSQKTMVEALASRLSSF